MSEETDQDCEYLDYNDTAANWYLAAAVAGMVFLGLLLAFDGIDTIADRAFDESLLSNSDGYFATTLIVSLIVLAFSLAGFRSGATFESLIMMIVAVNFMVYSFGLVTPIEMPGLDLLTGILLVILSVVSFVRRDIMLGTATLVFGLVCILWSFDSYSLLNGIMSLISGAIFLYIGLSDLIYSETGVDLPIV